MKFLVIVFALFAFSCLIPSCMNWMLWFVVGSFLFSGSNMLIHNLTARCTCIASLYAYVSFCLLHNTKRVQARGNSSYVGISYHVMKSACTRVVCFLSRDDKFGCELDSVQNENGMYELKWYERHGNICDENRHFVCQQKSCRFAWQHTVRFGQKWMTHLRITKTQIIIPTNEFIMFQHFLLAKSNRSKSDYSISLAFRDG